MTIADIDALFENIFLGGEPEDEGNGPEPLNRRFNWVDPTSGKPPPQIPPEALPDEEQGVPVAGEPEVEQSIPIKHVEPSDRKGVYSLNDLIPPDELATIDQLLDLKLRAQKSKGKTRQALDREFQAHRSEFEALIAKIVNVILEGDFESKFDRSMKSLGSTVDRSNRDIDNMFKSLPTKKRHPTDKVKAGQASRRAAQVRGL